jgi:hypothetical protein
MKNRNRSRLWLGCPMIVLMMFAVLVMIGIARQQSKPLAEQNPDQLCKCSGDDSKDKGGSPTFEAFKKKYGSQFTSAAQAQLGWRVYQASNRCNAVMVIGRLADTESFEGKPGYCVLRGLRDWSVAINDVFIHGGTDRQSAFMLVSQSPHESLGAIRPEQVERDRETNWRVIYNHEISEVQNTERYKLTGNPDTFSPQKPGRFEPKTCQDISGSWSGTLVVRDVKGPSNIQPGQNRPATITIEQSGCRVRLHFNTNEIAGYLRPGEAPPSTSGTLDEVINGALSRAELLTAPTGPLDLTIVQTAANGVTITSRGKITRR